MHILILYGAESIFVFLPHLRIFLKDNLSRFGTVESIYAVVVKP